MPPIPVLHTHPSHAVPPLRLYGCLVHPACVEHHFCIVLLSGVLHYDGNHVCFGVSLFEADAGFEDDAFDSMYESMSITEHVC